MVFRVVSFCFSERGGNESRGRERNLFSSGRTTGDRGRARERDRAKEHLKFLNCEFLKCYANKALMYFRENNSIKYWFHFGEPSGFLLYFKNGLKRKSHIQ